VTLLGGEKARKALVHILPSRIAIDLDRHAIARCGF
jgi:hypothetical protein